MVISANGKVKYKQLKSKFRWAEPNIKPGKGSTLLFIDEIQNSPAD